MTNPELILNDFNERLHENDITSIEYYDEMTKYKPYQMNEQFRKIVDKLFNEYCFNNSIFNKIDYSLLNDEQYLFMKLIKYNELEMPKGRYEKNILKYYIENINKVINEIKMENINFINSYRDKVPPLYIKLDNPSDDELKYNQNVNSKLISYTTDFLKLGLSLFFNVKGFPKNNLLAILYGMAVYSAMSKSFDNFKELVSHLKSFIQLNFNSLCLDPEEDNVEDYNLITYLKFKDGRYNFRYSCAEKYFNENEKLKGQTEYIINGNEKYISTKYKDKDELHKKWESLEEEYHKRGITDDLIINWFDGQLFTRSTCLIGCMLIAMKENKYISFINDEMPDWKAIAQYTIKGTYTTGDEIKKLKIDKITLKDVLDVLYNYVKHVEMNK